MTESGGCSDLRPDACYQKAVRATRDVEYFEAKNNSRELACTRWLDILSLCWDASTIGEQLREDFQADPYGVSALETLKAAFGVKSPATLLKRASAFQQYFARRETSSTSGWSSTPPLPLVESDVWQYFLFLRARRQKMQRGYTTATAFLEAVRFGKHVLGLKGADSILEARRCLGFAALEKQAKGPVSQAPPLELVHIQRLHMILEGDGCLVEDRLGAGVMLVCVYARARHPIRAAG